MPRKITTDEESVYRLCHHEFKGYTVKQAARIMGFSENKIRRLLKNLKIKAPRLFPIITLRQHLIYRLYVDMGLSQYKIAAYLNTTQSNIHAILDRLKKKGMPFLEPHGVGNMVAYESGMDDNIFHKF